MTCQDLDALSVFFDVKYQRTDFMNSDCLLSEALEHHQAQRFQQAEAIYRSVLEQNANQGDALHWLGLLYHQQSKSEAALAFLGRALQFCPSIASYHHNYAEAWLAVGELRQAIACFRQALSLNADQGPSHASLALTLNRVGDFAGALSHFESAIRLNVRHPNIYYSYGRAASQLKKFEAAIENFRIAIELDPKFAMAHHHLGESLGMAGETELAGQSFQDAIKLQPDLAKPYHGMGVVYGRLGQAAKAKQAFRKALELEPSLAEAEQGMASLCHRNGEVTAAVEHYHRAVELSPTYLIPRLGLCKLFEQTGRLTEAVVVCEQLVELCPKSASLQHYLASLTGENPPATSPPSMIAAQFDNYADHFDEHLVDMLSYQGPAVLKAAALAYLGGDELDIVDLGCGTGLCGLAFQDQARTLTGIDLSKEMLSRAKSRGIYSQLNEGEITRELLNFPAAFDLALSADVFIYIGDLEPVFSVLAKALRPAGICAFTVESLDSTQNEEDYQLQLNRRYAHSESYLRRVAEKQGFGVLSIAKAEVRTERGQNVPGLVAVFQREA